MPHDPPSHFRFFCEDVDTCHSTLNNLMSGLGELYADELKQHPERVQQVIFPVFVRFETALAYSHTPHYLQEHNALAARQVLQLVSLTWDSVHASEFAENGPLPEGLPANIRLAQPKFGLKTLSS